jgi:uncharacterized protein (TIGR03067 family)
VSLLERASWAAAFGLVVWAVAYLVAGRDNPVPVLVLTLGGAILGTTQAEGLARRRRTRAALNQFRGSWRLAEVNGKEVTDADGPAIRTTVDGYEFTDWKGETPTSRGSIWLDPTKRPAAINVVPREGPGATATILGVYELDGKVLRVCINHKGGPRPTGLEVEPDRQRLMVYRKE